MAPWQHFWTACCRPRPPLQVLVRSCLSHDPKARPTARQLLAELTRLLQEEVDGSLA